MNRLLSRVVTATAATVAALMLIAAAIGFLGAALYFWLVSLALRPAPAALIVGLAGLALAVAILLIAWLICGRRRRPATAATARTPAATTDAAGELGQAVAREALLLAHAHPYRAFAIALSAGFAAGLSPELRRMFTSGFKR